MTFNLGSLLDQEDLNLRLVTGERECLARPIAGAHAIEIDHPVRWLEEHWVMLTTGVRLRQNAAAQRALVAELDRGRITALGFAEKITFQHVPRALREEAERRGFPVFAIPFETPHREIVSFVNRSLLSNDYYLLQRSISMQNYLMDALGAERPEEELVTRLASLLGSTVLLYGPNGRLEASRGEAPAASIWTGVTAREASLQEFTVGRWYVVSVPILVSGVTRHWLAIATRRRSVSEQVARPVIRAAERLLGLTASARETAVVREQAVRSELLRRVLTEAGAADGAVADRMVAFGLEAGGTCCIALVAPTPGAEPHAIERGRPLLESLLTASLQPYLIVQSGAELTVLVEGRGQFEDWLRKLARAGIDLIAGVGRSFRSLERATESLRDAELALLQLRQEDGHGRALRFEALDLATSLVGDIAMERLKPKVDALLEPIRDSETLYETLLAYLDADLDVGRAARALHLHPNSLRYRLTRLEQLLGRSLRAPATIANLYLATTVERSADAARGPGRGVIP